MSITDELRKYAMGYETLVNHKLLEIAAIIDAEHEEACREQYNQGHNDGFDEGFASADDWLAQNEDEMAEHGWVRLPRDANGEYIHVGDKVICGVSVWTVTGLELVGERWNVRCTIYNESGGSGTALYSPVSLRHHHAPTVEDVLDEFVAHWMDTHREDIPALKAEYAAKLQLKEDA